MTLRRAVPGPGTLALLAVALAVAPVRLPAQSGPPPDPSRVTAPPGSPGQAAADVVRVELTAGKSVVVTTDFDITRVAITDPTVADAVVIEPREVLLDGKKPGTISMILWGGAGRRVAYELVVEAGVPALQQQLQTLFPGEDIRVGYLEEAVILTGQVSSNVIKLRVGEIAQATSSKLRVVNLLQLPGGAGSEQVLVQVRFAEVSRRALTAFGASFFTGATGYKDIIGSGTTGQFPGAAFDNLTRTEQDGQITLDGELTFSDFLNIFVFNTKYNVGAVVRALQQRGFFQSLAEPNLIAYNGQEASFLAGGEFPIPVVQGLSGAVHLEFKEFGVRLSFTPTIAGDLIRLKLRPEVSSLDFSSGLTLQGFRIPALITRRAETEVELRDGQSFAIAGLLDNAAQEDRSKVPVLGDIPILGQLFRSRSTRTERTELMLLVTARLVRPLNPDEVPPLPTMPGAFIKGGIGGDLFGGGGLADGPPIARPGTTSPGRGGGPPR